MFWFPLQRNPCCFSNPSRLNLQGVFRYSSLYYCAVHCTCFSCNSLLDPRLPSYHSFQAVTAFFNAELVHFTQNLSKSTKIWFYIDSCWEHQEVGGSHKVYQVNVRRVLHCRRFCLSTCKVLNHDNKLAAKHISERHGVCSRNSTSRLRQTGKVSTCSLLHGCKRFTVQKLIDQLRFCVKHWVFSIIWYHEISEEKEFWVGSLLRFFSSSVA